MRQEKTPGILLPSLEIYQPEFADFHSRDFPKCPETLLAGSRNPLSSNDVTPTRVEPWHLLLLSNSHDIRTPKWNPSRTLSPLQGCRPGKLLTFPFPNQCSDTCMVALSSVFRVHCATAGNAWQMSSWERGGFVFRTTVVRISMAV